MCGRIQNTKAPIIEPNMDLEIATEGLKSLKGKLGKDIGMKKKGKRITISPSMFSPKFPPN
jgi:hypothetical protein